MTTITVVVQDLAHVDDVRVGYGEVSEHLVGSAAFKAVGTGEPRPAGSIPVHLRAGTYGGVLR